MSTMERILRLMSKRKRQTFTCPLTPLALIKINGECIPITKQCCCRTLAQPAV